MKLMFYALVVYVGYRIAVENRREPAPAKLLAPPRSEPMRQRPGADS
jgi:hypothetical protein